MARNSIGDWVITARMAIGTRILPNFAGALWVDRFLITGGWLTNHYQWNDQNIINLVLAIVESAAVLL